MNFFFTHYKSIDGMRRILILILFLFSFIGMYAQNETEAKQMKEKRQAGFCITSDAMILFNMINDYRRTNNLPLIPLSRSLSFVAMVHASDLQANNAAISECGLHSWSDKGNWKPCCYARDHAQASCMSNKPKELTGYPGSGYEIAYWDEEQATPSGAMELWKSTVVSKNVFLNRDKWQSKKWKAMGVALLDGYAIVWLGDKADSLADITLCGTDSLVQLASSPVIAPVAAVKEVPLKKDIPAVKAVEKKETGPEKEKQNQKQARKNADQFYLVIASLRDEQLAAREVEKLQERGFSNATVQAGEDVYRVTIGVYATREEAQKKLNKYISEFKGIWILRQ